MKMMDSLPENARAMPEQLAQGTRRVVVFGNGMLPLYRHGDVLIVSESAPISVGDRVVLQTRNFGTIGGTLIHRDKDKVVVGGSGISRRDRVVGGSDVEFIGRVIWASQ